MHRQYKDFSSRQVTYLFRLSEQFLCLTESRAAHSDPGAVYPRGGITGETSCPLQGLFWSGSNRILYLPGAFV